MGRAVVVRILGVASTTKGFAFAVTEGPRRLVLWGMERGRGAKISASLTRLLERSRPLFVAFDKLASDKKRSRGRLFSVFLDRACVSPRVMILPVQATKAVATIQGLPIRTKLDLAKALAVDFRELSHVLPEKRKVWKSEDDRIGVFMALATAVAAWNGFRTPLDQNK